MSREIVMQMRAEEADLMRKLQAVRAVLAAYGETPALESGGLPVRQRAAYPRKEREKVGITTFLENTRPSVLFALEAMAHAHGLMRTKDLVAYIEKRGHEITGSNKVNALGALLARSEDVQGHGKAGWSVANRERALAILNEHLYKDYGPHSANAGGPETAPYALTEEAPEW